MKNRKFIVVAFMLIACMIVGVGYAALTDTLNLFGDAEVSHANAENAFDGEVYFSQVSTGEGYTASIDADGDSGRYKISGLSGQNDAISVTYTIFNDSDVDATVKIDSTNTTSTNNTVFNVAYNIAADQTIEIGAGKTYELVVTVTLLETPVLAEGQTVSGTFTLELDVTSAE